MHVDLDGDAREQLLDAGDVEAEQMPAHVILMGVGDERAEELHVVPLHLIDDGVDLPRRVHHHALARLGVADEIHEVLHRAELHLLQIDRLAHLGHSVQ